MKIKILGLIVFICGSAYSNSPWSSDYSEVASRAIAENKHIMVTIYNDVKSRKYIESLEADSNLNRVLHKKFIPLKINATLNNDINWAAKFLISEFPTQIIMTPNGQIYNKVKGEIPLEGDDNFVEFIESSKRKIRNEDAYFGYSTELKPIIPEFVNQFFNDSNHTEIQNEIVQNYWDTCTDFYSENSFRVMYCFGGNSTIDQLYIDSFKFFRAQFGYDDSYFIVREIAKKRIRPMIEEHHRLNYLTAVDLAKSLIHPFEHDKFEEEMREEWIVKNEMWNQYIVMMEKQRMAVGKKKFNVYTFDKIIANCNDKDILKISRDWLASDIEKEATLEKQVLYAKLLFKLKAKRELIPAIKKAIDYSTKEGADTVALHEMLIKLIEN